MSRAGSWICGLIDTPERGENAKSSAIARSIRSDFASWLARTGGLEPAQVTQGEVKGRRSDFPSLQASRPERAGTFSIFIGFSHGRPVEIQCDGHPERKNFE